MIAWYERAVAPVLLGGAVLIYGRLQGHGSGYQVFVRYFGLWILGLTAIIFTNDLLDKVFSAAPIVFGTAWTLMVGAVLHKRHLS